MKFVLSEVVQRKSFCFTVSVNEPPVIAPSATRHKFELPSHPFNVAPSKSETVSPLGGGAAPWANDATATKTQSTTGMSFMMRPFVTDHPSCAKRRNDGSMFDKPLRNVGFRRARARAAHSHLLADPIGFRCSPRLGSVFRGEFL